MYLSRSQAHRGWYLAITKSGVIKTGKKTMFGQKSIEFIPRSTKPPSESEES